MFTFLLVVHAIIAAALVAVILMQRSEGGGLGMGGSPSGLMSARGAADFLTRATTILATAFILMSIGLAALATFQRGPRQIDTSLARQTAPEALPAAPAPAVPLAGDPLAAAAAGAAANGPSSGTGAIVPATPGTAGPATAPKETTPASERAKLPDAPAARPRGERGAAKTLDSKSGGVGVATGAAAAPVILAPPAATPATAAPSGTNP